MKKIDQMGINIFVMFFLMLGGFNFLIKILIFLKGFNNPLDYINFFFRL